MKRIPPTLFLLGFILMGGVFSALASKDPGHSLAERLFDLPQLQEPESRQGVPDHLECAADSQQRAADY